MNIRSMWMAAALAALAVAGCGKPGADTLGDSFAQQLASNKFIKDFQRNGDDLTFTGPGAEGGTAKWRVHIDSAIVEANTDSGVDTAAQPYKGTVKSSWYSDAQQIRASGRDSGLPFELTANGLSQYCWAYWEQAAKKWSWE
jgi:hypothetical protein